MDIKNFDPRGVRFAEHTGYENSEAYYNKLTDDILSSLFDAPHVVTASIFLHLTGAFSLLVIYVLWVINMVYVLIRFNPLVFKYVSLARRH